MGINLGVALGAAAESGTQSFALFRKMQQDEERLARDRERFEQERERFGREQKTWQEQDASSKLMQEAYRGPDVTGPTDQALNVMTGKDVSGQRLTPEARSQLNTQLAALSPEERQAALGAYKSSYYNPEQAYVDAALKAGNQTALKEARASQLTGLQIQGVQQGITKGEYELRGLQRGEERDAKFRETLDTLHQKQTKQLDEVSTIAETEGMKGLVQRYGADLKKAYGHDVALVGNNIVVKDAQGKPIGQPISSINEAKAALQQHFKTQFSADFHREMMPLFGSPAELTNYLNKREEIGIKGREVATKEALVPSEVKKNEAAANQANAHAGLYSNMLKVAKENSAAGEAMKPYLDKIATLVAKDPKAADSDEVQALLVQAATAGAQKSKDIAGLLSTLRKKDTSGIDAEWSAKEDKLITAGVPMPERAKEREAFYAQRGFAPAVRTEAVMSGKWPDGKPMNATDVADFNRRYPNSRIDPKSLSWLDKQTPTAKPAAAIDTEATPTTTPGGNFYAPEAIAARKQSMAQRARLEADAAAAAAAAREQEAARVRNAIAEDFARKYK